MAMQEAAGKLKLSSTVLADKQPLYIGVVLNAMTAYWARLV